jgi:hypothetical protein
MTAAFKAAIRKLAHLMTSATDEHGGNPNYDWSAFAKSAIAELPPNQRAEVYRSNDATFQRALWAAVNQSTWGSVAWKPDA